MENQPENNRTRWNRFFHSNNGSQLTLGIGVGVAIGLALNNLALGIAIGIAIYGGEVYENRRRNR